MNKKARFINPKFIKAMHKNTTMDDHAVVVLKIELRRTARGYKEKVIGMYSFADGLYECLKDFGVDIEDKE